MRIPVAALLSLLYAVPPLPQTEVETLRQYWNRVYSGQGEQFNPHPNAFLQDMVYRLRPGRALDLGMGQGRNALFLAEEGWEVTGVDIAEEGLEIAGREAERRGLRLDLVHEDAYRFDIGRERWDLIALIYFDVRPLLPRLVEGLRPGGLIVIEAFHQEAAVHNVGPEVRWETNQLVELFLEQGFTVVRYEDTRGLADFGKMETRLVRLAARKPAPSGR
jgi:2-polyprenyl-3-methyl-5-hydroxy-6-metoxy-1,4-benzoquinol methylase